jgi:hypothetical protein
VRRRKFFSTVAGERIAESVVRRSETFGAVYASVGWIMDLTEYLRVLRKGGIKRKRAKHQKEHK